MLVVFVAALTIPWSARATIPFLQRRLRSSALFAMSLNLLLGTTGLVSFGHVAYFGIGSYVCGILMKTYAVPFAIALPAAAARRRRLARWCSASSACASPRSTSPC